jgi:hypothetical protein
MIQKHWIFVSKAAGAGGRGLGRILAALFGAEPLKPETDSNTNRFIFEAQSDCVSFRISCSMVVVGISTMNLVLRKTN